MMNCAENVSVSQRLCLGFVNQYCFFFCYKFLDTLPYFNMYSDICFTRAYTQRVGVISDAHY